MDPERWQRVRAVLQEAAELDPGDADDSSIARVRIRKIGTK